MPSANIVDGMQMLVQKIAVGLFSLVFLVLKHITRGKNVFICRKTCARKSEHFPFDTLEDKFTIMASVKALKKDLSSFQAMKPCPQCWCLWLFLFL